MLKNPFGVDIPALDGRFGVVFSTEALMPCRD
jgi:hypothetical protein